MTRIVRITERFFAQRRDDDEAEDVGDQDEIKAVVQVAGEIHDG
jgi:hypothetical protein